MQNLSRGAAVALYAIAISQSKRMDFESRTAHAAKFGDLHMTV
jgi:hypothetical protein